MEGTDGVWSAGQSMVLLVLRSHPHADRVSIGCSRSSIAHSGDLQREEREVNCIMPASEVTYQSVYNYAVDESRRVQLPLPWRTVEPVDLTMIIWPQHDCGPCLRVLPKEEMDKLREKIEMMPIAEKTSLKRHIGSSSFKVELDNAKRITIPKEMAEFVGIKDEAVFTGMLDYFEIWGPIRYAEMRSYEDRAVKRAIKLLE